MCSCLCTQALLHFRSLGKRLLFLTNNSSKSRRQYRSKFEALGIQVAPEEIVPTSYAAAAYLKSIGFAEVSAAEGKKVFLVGNEGVAQELEAAGIPHTTFEQVASSGDSAAAALRQRWTAEGFAELQLDRSIGAVVVGWDPSFSYAHLCYASACLRELPGCLFVATNLDPADNMGGWGAGRGGWHWQRGRTTGWLALVCQTARRRRLVFSSMRPLHCRCALQAMGA
jgi:ribonucleotide monophosphatase NagD (HAD superfamily)